MPKSKSEGPVVLIIEDAADRSKLRFDTWGEAHDHIRQVILGQIIEQLAEIAAQDDPSRFKEEVDELADIGKSVNYPRDAEELRLAVEQWKDFTDEGTGFTWIEVV